MSLPSIPAPYQTLVWILIGIVVGLWLFSLLMNKLAGQFKTCERCARAYLARLPECPYCPGSK